ncbi:MAG: hypothetical protein K0S04_2223 [Herbinix sp.]|jgi:hypothetical protein|nr:hypothetical protein [Herbinix sp.]
MEASTPVFRTPSIDSQKSASGFFKFVLLPNPEFSVESIYQQNKIHAV